MSTNKVFINSRKEFNRKQLLELNEVFTAVYDTNKKNIFIKDTRLLCTVFTIPVTLIEFETIQLKNIYEVIFFLWLLLKYALNILINYMCLDF